MVVTAGTLGLAARTADAQFYGGGYWVSPVFGGTTVQGDASRGAAEYAMGLGQYNVDQANAMAMNSNTLMQWNQYLYQSRLESARSYHAKQAKADAKRREGAEAVRARLRNQATAEDISRGDALNVLLDELSDPKLAAKVASDGARFKIGGGAVRNIPFQYASAAISVSARQLVDGDPPAAFKDPKFADDRNALRTLADELKKEGQELGTHKPETIKKAKDQILATRAKVETVLPKGSADRQAAERYLKALYALTRMLETPAVNLLLAGVEKRPDATLGDLLKFMSGYNLRFGLASTPPQREVYAAIYPQLHKLAQDVAAGNAASETAGPASSESAPIAVFGGMTYDQLDGKLPTSPK